MQQIADWLKTLGISEYVQRFSENDVDTSVLRHLTDQDLSSDRCLSLARSSAYCPPSTPASSLRAALSPAGARPPESA
jgi:hypothetical protein